MATAIVNGISVGYDDEGAGAPLVLVHGHPFDRSMWAPQVGEFASSGWRVIAPDLRGYGESRVTPGPFAWVTFARDIAALLDYLHVDDVVLGGLSMGGQIVMEFVRLFPDRVRGLVLADTFCQAETEDGRKARYDQADRLLREGMRGYANEVLSMMVAPYNVTALPAVADHVAAMMLGTSPAGAAAALRARAERPDYTDLLARMPVPAVVVVGRDDEFTRSPSPSSWRNSSRRRHWQSLTVPPTYPTWSDQPNSTAYCTATWREDDGSHERFHLATPSDGSESNNAAA